MSQQRKHARIQFETHVVIDVEGEKLEGTTVNLSQGGALITTSSPLSFGQRLSLQLRIPKIQEPCTISGVVRWCKESSIGVQFETLRAIEVWGINQLIHS